MFDLKNCAKFATTDFSHILKCCIVSLFAIKHFILTDRELDSSALKNRARALIRRKFYIITNSI